MDKRKGALAGLEKSGSVQQFSFYFTIIGVLLTIIFFIIQLVLSYVEKEKASLSGTLLPDSKSTPVNHCGDIPSGANAIFLGNSVSYSSRFPHTVIQVNGQDLLMIDKSKNNITV